MNVRRPVVFALLAILAITAAPAAARSYHAERFDVHVALEPDGSALVTETIVFRFTEGEFTRVFREVPTGNTDGIDVIRALVDGRDVTQETQIGRRASRVRVTWVLPPTSGVAREFVLTYRMRGVVARENGRDAFRWRALPYEHDYRILASAVTIQLPPGATFDGTPAVSSPGGDNRRRVAVSATTSSNRAAFSAADIGRNGTYTIRLHTAAGQLASAMPAWQQRAVDRQARAPLAWTVAGVGGLLALTLVLVMWRNAPRPDASVPRHVSRQAEPPDTTPPALAGALKKNGRADSGLALASLFDLARRNVVRIEEQPRTSRWTPRTFTVIRRESPAGLRPHEREVLLLAFRDAQAQTVKLSDLAGKLNMKGAAFRRAVVAELREARWLDEDRLAARRRSYLAAGAVLGAAVASVLLAALTLDYWGPWGFAVPMTLGVVSVVGFALASTLPVLTDEGVRQSLRWVGFGREIKSLARSHSGPTGDTLAAWFAYAVALGVGPALAKRLDAAGLAHPVDWLHVVPGADGTVHGGFTAMMSGSGGAAGIGGGAGGGGAAAGGGSSGAH